MYRGIIQKTDDEIFICDVVSFKYLTLVKITKYVCTETKCRGEKEDNSS